MTQRETLKSVLIGKSEGGSGSGSMTQKSYALKPDAYVISNHNRLILRKALKKQLCFKLDIVVEQVKYLKVLKRCKFRFEFTLHLFEF